MSQCAHGTNDAMCAGSERGMPLYEGRERNGSMIVSQSRARWIIETLDKLSKCVTRHIEGEAGLPAPPTPPSIGAAEGEAPTTEADLYCRLDVGLDFALERIEQLDMDFVRTQLKQSALLKRIEALEAANNPKGPA